MKPQRPNLRHIVKRIADLPLCPYAGDLNVHRPRKER